MYMHVGKINSLGTISRNILQFKCENCGSTSTRLWCSSHVALFCPPCHRLNMWTMGPIQCKFWGRIRVQKLEVLGVESSELLQGAPHSWVRRSCTLVQNREWIQWSSVDTSRYQFCRSGNVPVENCCQTLFRHNVSFFKFNFTITICLKMNCNKRL